MITKTSLQIKGMTCSSCVQVIEMSLKKEYGISSVSVNLATNQAQIEFDNEKISLEKIKKIIKKSGYQLEKSTKNIKNTEYEKYFYRFIFSGILSFPVFMMMFFNTMIGIKYLQVDISMWIFMSLSFIVVFILGFSFHKNALKNLLKGRFNMDSLVSIGTTTAFFYSFYEMFKGGHVYFEAAVGIVTLINLGKFFEAKAKAKAGDAIMKLLELGVKKAIILENGKNIEKDIDDIKVGEILIVKPGEKIPLDGIILEGNSNIDESMLTGESIPVFKPEGLEVFGGTICLDGNIKVQVLKENNNGTLANIIKMVGEAQSSKAPIQKLVDKISGFFVPIIILISIITFVVWYLVTGSIEKSILSAVATLVIACPCSLGLATPTAIMVGSGVGAKKGILIKNSETLEKTKDIDVMIFDKTGTLTNGKPEVTDILNFEIDKELFIKYTSSLALLSHHPLSKSIASIYSGDFLEIQDFQEIKGQGIIGKINGKKIFLGNKKLFENFKIKLPKNILENIENLSKNGKTPNIVGLDNKIIGIIGLIDLPKKSSKKVISDLQKLGIKTIMLTGDTYNTANYISNKLNIDDVIAEVMPEDKLQTIKKYQKDGNKVAFVGDGINDAPALVQADLSIAMGTGSDIAMESSDIVLVGGDLEKVLTAINLSKATLKTIKNNLFWAFVYNIIGVPMAAFGLLNPMFASFAMSMSSVCVIGNSLRLKTFLKK